MRIKVKLYLTAFLLISISTCWTLVYAQEKLAPINCDDFQISLIPGHVQSCPTSNTGFIQVQMNLTEDDLDGFWWSNGSETLNQQDLAAGEYTLMVAFIDAEENECFKSISIEILEPEYEVFLDVTDVSSCDAMDGAVKLRGIIYEGLSVGGRPGCYSGPKNINVDVSSATILQEEDDAIIQTGDIFVIPEGDLFNGKLIMMGGTLVVNGYLFPSEFDFNGGTIISNGMITMSNLIVDHEIIIPVGAEIINYGTLSASAFTVAGKITNYDDVTCYDNFQIESGGLVTNNGDIFIDQQLLNAGVIENFSELYVSGDLNNSGSITNHCTLELEGSLLNESELINKGSARINLNIQNNGQLLVEEGSSLTCGTLVNIGGISASGAGCYCFKVKNGSSLHPGSQITAENIETPDVVNASCGCDLKPTEAYFVLDDGSGTKVTEFNNLASGFYVFNIDLGIEPTCIVEEEVFIRGGATLNLIEDQTICYGDIVSLEAEINGEDDNDDGEGHTFTWSPSGSFIDYEDGPYQEAAPIVTTTYTVNGVADNGCEASGQVTVTVVPPLEIEVSSGTTICAGESYQLSASTVTSGNLIYQWEPGIGLSDTRIANPVAIPDQTTTYIVTVTNEDTGCEATASIEIVVNPMPQISIAGGTEVNLCEGGSTQLQADGGASYEWAPSSGLSGVTISNPVASPTTSTIYTVTGTGENGCESTVAVNINVFPKDQVSVEIDPTKCLDRKRQLVATGGSSYRWSPSNGLDNPDIADPVATLTESTLYTVTITSANGCQQDLTLTVDPVLWPDVGEDRTICFGETTQLNAIGDNITTYNWTPAFGLSDPSVSNPIAEINATATYKVEATDSYGCKNTNEITIFVDPACRCNQPDPAGGITFQWTGKNSSEWSDPGNWTSVSPGRVPGGDPGDNVVIEAPVDGNPIVKMDNNKIINNICLISGTLNLQAFTLTINGEANFIEGEVSAGNFYNVDNKIYVNGQGQSGVYFGKTIFNATVVAERCASLYLNGSTFNRAVSLEYSGSESIYCLGGNKYNGIETEITNSGSGDLYLSYLPGGANDVYNSSVTFSETSSGKLYPNSSFTDEFKRDVIISHNPVVFGLNEGITLINGSVDQYISGSPSSSGTLFKKLRIKKDISSRFSNVVLSIPITVGNAENDFLQLEKGIIKSSATSLVTITNGTKVSGASNHSFIDGPVKKMGNEDFIFPIGKQEIYLPLAISEATTPNASAEYIAEFFFGEQLFGEPLEPLTHLSTCEYWRLSKPVEDGINVKVTLSWNSLSCDIASDVKKMQVTGWNGSEWKAYGNGNYTGSKILGGTISTENAIPHCEAYVLGSEIVPGYGPTIGLSLNNYGAKVTNQANINVYGNVLNEVGYDGGSGLFNNSGLIKIYIDWTNNSENKGFSDLQGKVEMVGGYQRFRGQYLTRFYDLVTDGHGKKEMFSDIDISGFLDLKTNHLATRSYKLFIDNTDPEAIIRTGGFISSDKGGYLKRRMDFSSATTYLFPVGVRARYRPITLIPASIGPNEHNFSIRMADGDPDEDGLDRTVKTASVHSVNEHFYHWIQKDDGINPEDQDAVSLTMYFNRKMDGAFQSIGHWDNEGEILPPPLIGRPESNIWKKASFISTSKNTDILAPDVLNIDSWFDFSNPQFALIKGAFILNTAEFGNPFGEGDGVTYTMTGDSFEDTQPDYSVKQGTDQIGQSIAPDDLASTHIMEIKGDAFSVPGKLAITTNSNADIESVEFIDKDGNVLPLADGLYSKENNLLVLHSEPQQLEKETESPITITFSFEDPLILFKSRLSEFSITGVSASDTNLAMNIIDREGDVRLTLTGVDLINWNGYLNVEDGNYQFELIVSAENGNQSGKHVFKGQFFVMQ